MQDILSTLLQAVLIAVVPIIAGFVAKGVVALSQYLGVKTDNATVAKYAQEIAQAVATAVTYVSQTYVDELKKSGTFTEENQKIAIEKALEVARQQLTQEALEFITTAYGDITEYLTSLLEAEVRNQKEAPPTVRMITE